MFIGLTGTNASGKTSIVKYLKSKGFEYFSLSDVIRQELTKRGLEHSRDNLRRVGNELRQNFGADILAKKISQQLSSNHAVIDSIRNIYEVAALRKLKNFTLIAVDAPIEIRFKRATSRGRLENAYNIEKFIELEEKEKSRNKSAQNIDQCIKKADFYIYNDRSIKVLYKKLDRIIQIIAGNETFLG